MAQKLGRLSNFPSSELLNNSAFAFLKNPVRETPKYMINGTRQGLSETSPGKARH